MGRWFHFASFKDMQGGLSTLTESSFAVINTLLHSQETGGEEVYMAPGIAT